MKLTAYAYLIWMSLSSITWAQERYRGEDVLSLLDPMTAAWRISFEKEARGQLSPSPTATLQTKTGSLQVVLSDKPDRSVGIAARPWNRDLSRLEEIHLWVQADSDIMVQPFSQSSGFVFRDGGFPDVRVTGGGAVTMLRIKQGSMVDPAMVESIGIQIRSGHRRNAELRLLAVTGSPKPPSSTTARLALAAPSVPSAAPLHTVFSVDFDLTRTYDNPYDPDQIDVQAQFTSPSGKILDLPAFWFQDYQVAPGTERWEQYTPSGTPRWRLRYLPLEEGRHTFRLTAKDNSGNVENAGPFEFDVTGSPSPGPVGRHSASQHLLQYASGMPYIPFGHNLSFEDGNPDLNGTAYYRSFLPLFAASGENWTRFWMTDFSRTTLEWGSGHFSGFYQGVGRYSQRAAWRVDRFMDISLANGVQVQLVLNDHGQFSSWVNQRWNSANPANSSNAYNSLSGGPVPDANPEQFFSNSAARALFRRRLRYLIARWSAYPNLLAWELFNEVQFAGSPSKNLQTDAVTRAAIIDWHREMADFLKAHDPFRHLVTTSSDESGAYGFSSIWNLPSIDLVQSHHYGQPPETRDARIRDFVDGAQRAYGKPVIIGETGVKASLQPENHFDPSLFLSNTEVPAAERTAANRDHMIAGTTMRNALWSAALSRSGAMNWWWGSYIARDLARHRQEPDFPLNAYLFPPLVSYWGGEDPADPPLHGAALQVFGQIKAYGLQGTTRAFIWVRDSREAYGTGFGPATFESRKTSGASVSLNGLDPGTYVVSYWSGRENGGLMSQSTASVKNGILDLPLPTFQGDIALKITRGTTLAWGSVPRTAGAWIAASDASNYQNGYAIFPAVPASFEVAAGAILTLVDGNDLVSELTVPAAPAAKSLWTVAEIGAPGETGLALVNTGPATAAIQLRITGSDGSNRGSRNISLAPGEHIAKFLVEWFGTGLAPFRGALEVFSDQPLAALALRGDNNDQGQFIMTSIPTYDAAGALNSQPMILPQVVDGGGYQTEWLMLNPFDSSLSGKIRFFRSDGTPWSLTAEGITSPEQPYRISAHGLTRWLSTGSAAEVSAGYCLLDPDPGQRIPAGGAVIRYLPQGRLLSETGLPFLAASTATNAYYEIGPDLDTAIALVNPANREQQVLLEIYLRKGAEEVLSSRVSLPAGGHSAKFITQLIAGLPAGSRGYLKISSDLPAAFLPLRMRTTSRGVLFSSLLLNPLAAGRHCLLPQIVYGGGFQTQFITLNSGKLAAGGKISFFDSFGNASVVLLRNP